MTTYTGSVCFRSPEDGGRRSGPPPGPTYMATAVAALGGEAEVLPGWPATGPQFSVVLEFRGAPGEGSWSAATVRPLIDVAPGSDALVPGAEIVILEGPREVARMLVDPDEMSST